MFSHRSRRTRISRRIAGSGMIDSKPYHPAYFDLAIGDGIAVATFHSEQLTEEDNLEQLGQELFALVEQFQYLKIVVDLSPLRYVTSAVLGKFITLHRRLGRSNGQLILCHLSPELQEVLRTSKLLTYFNTAEDVAAAKALLAG
jgi:anti-sigma B factor antagonist